MKWLDKVIGSFGWEPSQAKTVDELSGYKKKKVDIPWPGYADTSTIEYDDRTDAEKALGALKVPEARKPKLGNKLMGLGLGFFKGWQEAQGRPTTHIESAIENLFGRGDNLAQAQTDFKNKVATIGEQARQANERLNRDQRAAAVAEQAASREQIARLQAQARADQIDAQNQNKLEVQNLRNDAARERILADAGKVADVQFKGRPGWAFHRWDPPDNMKGWVKLVIPGYENVTLFAPDIDYGRQLDAESQRQKFIIGEPEAETYNRNQLMVKLHGKPFAAGDYVNPKMMSMVSQMENRNQQLSLWAQRLQLAAQAAKDKGDARSEQLLKDQVGRVQRAINDHARNVQSAFTLMLPSDQDKALAVAEKSFEDTIALLANNPDQPKIQKMPIASFPGTVPMGNVDKFRFNRR